MIEITLLFMVLIAIGVSVIGYIAHQQCKVLKADKLAITLLKGEIKALETKNRILRENIELLEGMQVVEAFDKPLTIDKQTGEIK